MNEPTPVQLHPWRDPDELIEALFRVGKERVPELRDPILRLTEHDDPEIREEAIRILCTRWKDRDAGPRAAKAFRTDPAPNVRSAAAFALSATATETTREADTRLLLAALEDEVEELDVRSAAYDALIILHRKPSEGRWPFPTKRRMFDPDRDVDWAWVRRLAT